MSDLGCDPRGAMLKRLMVDGDSVKEDPKTGAFIVTRAVVHEDGSREILEVEALTGPPLQGDPGDETEYRNFDDPNCECIEGPDGTCLICGYDW